MYQSNRALLAPELYVLHPDGSATVATPMQVALRIAELLAKTSVIPDERPAVASAHCPGCRYADDDSAAGDACHQCA